MRGMRSKDLRSLLKALMWEDLVEQDFWSSPCSSPVTVLFT